MPSTLPDCHLVRTAILFLSYSLFRQPRCFPPQSIHFVSLFCRPGFKGRSRALPWPGRKAALFPHPPAPLKAGYICTQRYGTWPMHRIAGSQSVSYAARKYHNGSTSAHKNRSPRKQGRDNHAIGKRPESASAPKTRFPPAPTQNWAFQAGTTGFIDMPFRGFLGPP